MPKFNEQKLVQLHLQHQAGFQTLRDLSGAAYDLGQEVQRIERELRQHPVELQASDFARTGREFREDVVKSHAELKTRIEKVKKERAALIAEYDRIKEIQDQRGALLLACKQTLEERGIKVELPDPRPNYVGPHRADVVVGGA